MEPLVLVCGHCHGEVPHGARVCRGCQAEIEYGAPWQLYVAIVIAGILVAWTIQVKIPPELGILAFIVGAAIAIGGNILAYRMLKDRVVFKRIYKTK